MTCSKIAFLAIAGLLVSAPLGAATVALAQSQQPARPAQTAQATPPAAPTGPVKTETTNFENWVLTCQELPPAAGAKTGKKTCWAIMRVTDGKTNRVVIVWKLGRDAKDVPTLAITTPTGVLVRDGVDVTLGQTVRKLAYQWCSPQECEASSPYDAAFEKDLAAGKEATLVFKLQDGRQLNVKVAINGIDKVLAALKKV